MEEMPFYLEGRYFIFALVSGSCLIILCYLKSNVWADLKNFFINLFVFKKYIIKGEVIGVEEEVDSGPKPEIEIPFWDFLTPRFNFFSAVVPKYYVFLRVENKEISLRIPLKIFNKIKQTNLINDRIEHLVSYNRFAWIDENWNINVI